MAAELAPAGVCIIKHTNPCGAAVSSAGDVAEAFVRALATDPVSAFGGIIGCNRPVTRALVERMGDLFVEAIIAPEFEADAMEGKVNGTLQVGWGGAIKLASDLSLARVKADQLMPAFTKDIAVTGKIEGNFAVSAEAPTVAALLATPKVQGKFRLTDGSVSNADLVAAMQSPDAAGRAGVTKFAELTGEFSAADGRAAYRALNLQGGVLRGGGGIDVGANGQLGGRLSVEIRSNVAQDRGAFSVTGTVAKPILRRGG